MVMTVNTWQVCVCVCESLWYRGVFSKHTHTHTINMKKQLKHTCVCVQSEHTWV